MVEGATISVREKKATVSYVCHLKIARYFVQARILLTQISFVKTLPICYLDVRVLYATCTWVQATSGLFRRAMIKRESGSGSFQKPTLKPELYPQLCAVPETETRRSRGHCTPTGRPAVELQFFTASQETCPCANAITPPGIEVWVCYVLRKPSFFPALPFERVGETRVRCNLNQTHWGSGFFMRFWFFTIWFAVWPVVPTAVAQTPAADTIFALPPVEVTAFRMPAARMLTPVRIDTFSDATIRATGSQHLADVLARAGGAFIRRQGTGLATLTLRGAAASQALILIDGIPFSDPQLGVVDLSLLPTSMFESVQVLHGQGSALYGSQSMGGLVNLKTRQPAAPRFAEASVRVGPYGERSGSLAAGVRHRRLAALVSLSRSTITGDFPYLNPSLFPPRESRREGADRDHRSAFGNFTFSSNQATTALTAWASDVERGIPGAASTSPAGERQWDHNRRLQVRHLFDAPAGLFSVTAAGQFNTLRYLNPRLALDQASKTTLAMAELEWSRLPLPFALTTGIAGHLYRASHPNLLDDTRESRWSWFANSHLSTPRAGLFPALRLDVIVPAAGPQLLALSPGLGLNLQPVENLPARLKMSAGKAFRAPTFNDRFWQPGGNPDLQAEYGWHYDAGLAAGASGTTLEATAFLHRIRNQITWLPGDVPNVWRPQNIGFTQSRGAEFSITHEFSLAPKSNLSGGLHYTLIRAVDRSDPDAPAYNQPLRYIPEHLLKSRAAFVYMAGDVHWRLDAAGRYVGRRYVTTDGSQYLAPYATFDLQLRITWQTGVARLTAGAFLENLTNNAYEVVRGYPVPPRTLHLQLSMRFAKNH